MHIDVLTVFPEFFSVLDLSLLGKAQEKGLLEIATHNLRDWTHDVHRTVDDTPAGGGAGMVMKPDVWGAAIDDLLAQRSQTSPVGEAPENATAAAIKNATASLSESALAPAPENATAPVPQNTVLAIPTPAGVPLTQEACGELAHAAHIIFACGRYEGIDARVAAHYAQRGLHVFEYSLGDYVLNGGEVAALALIEAVARLIPGMVGNPESLVEESHGRAGLLEYDNYTRPVAWRGLEVPAVLLAGDHGKVARLRRDQAIAKTATRRPDMIARLQASDLDKKDRASLSQHGWYLSKNSAHPCRLQIEEPHPDDFSRLAALAARNFPDACPPEMTEAAIAEFIAENLSPQRFAEYLDPDSPWLTLAAYANGEPVAYTLSLIPEGNGVAGLEDGAPDAQIGDLREGPLVELSKFYVDRDWRSSGLAGALWQATLQEYRTRLAAYKAPYVWLGTNGKNRRAHKAYRKLRFRKLAHRRFTVGGILNEDLVFGRPIHTDWPESKE
ncbi:tRNA (guanosine(37)-N1)-methyltransferase TrmD [Actinobaculum suis]|uniref:tRNA (guanosine(37)-N1)-methyltransferase TrmD n=1 Tax=Actinobaculum suis TaxID=1657 RepID=UPI0008087EDC|nr:tRNA (guanosine(37)-N1)-methyltransferase TrmD [Actinobaculum suis]OCA95657.1 tRNA (guanosine(37)-N1)-methyltransferase TrmD [Actinobaculum suis]OCA95858.1 tRNA (guanosine(37)-N1)-methyltransferase TrmD [Actinobaculum suis]